MLKVSLPCRPAPAPCRATGDCRQQGGAGAEPPCVCCEKHLLRFGILAATSRCVNSLKQIRVAAENLRWGLWLKNRVFSRSKSCCCWTLDAAELWDPIPPAGIECEMPTGTLPLQGNCCDPELHPEHPCLDQRISGDLFASPSSSSAAAEGLALDVIIGDAISPGRGWLKSSPSLIANNSSSSGLLCQN